MNLRRNIGCFIALAAMVQAAQAEILEVMTTGLGSGRVISGTTFNCTTGSPAADCTTDFTSTIRLTARGDTGSQFVQWHGDCAGVMATCDVMPGADAKVRAEFQFNPGIIDLTDLTPEGINRYLTGPDGANVTSAAAFLKALPEEYRQGWILMTRSESLQTGNATFPRVLVPGITAQYVFSMGLAPHTSNSSYPASHPDAIEFMQWDPVQRNFRFHEIVVAEVEIPAQTTMTPRGPVTIPARRRGVSFDEARCTRCHSTRNVLNRDLRRNGTDGLPSQPGWAKNKPNWDAYDSWAGAMPFNRDRIYQGSLEAAAFRRLLNFWTWREDPRSRAFMEQLQLQPPGVSSSDTIDRVEGSRGDGHVRFAFDLGATVTTEPRAAGLAGMRDGLSWVARNNVDFDLPAEAASSVERHGEFVVLRAPGRVQEDEGRGVQLFDRLGGLPDYFTAFADLTDPPDPTKGRFNQHRIGHELGKHVFATGGVPLDARPVALAITRGCLRIASTGAESTGPVALDVDQAWFRTRNDGLDVNALRGSTRLRTESLPLRKALLQKHNIDRDFDPYLFPGPTAVNDLWSSYGSATTPDPALGNLGRIRQEVLRRPIDLGRPDNTAIGRFYVDREEYGINVDPVALYRFFLEPLGVSVDKWSLGVRGRSRTYAFADVLGQYQDPMRYELELSLRASPYAAPATHPLGAFTLSPPFACDDLIRAVNRSLHVSQLPDERPTYTDVQRIFNKACIECHGGLGYPPFTTSFPVEHLDLAEEEAPARMSRLLRSYDKLAERGYLSSSSATNYLYARVSTGDENTCPGGRMPCGGPRLSEADLVTLRRWLDGSRMFSEGDPHLVTVDGVAYDFQSVGEFTMARAEGIEVQARQAPLPADTPLGPDAHSGLSMCPSITTAVAVDVAGQRITLQPNLSGQPDPSGMQLRVDGKLFEKLGSRGLVLAGGGRLLPTTASGGVQIIFPGGTDVVLTPQWLSYYQMWLVNYEVRHARANFGILGTVAPNNWLPALADGGLLGPRPAALNQRHQQLNEKLADSWRVTNTSSLFDYAPGTSTATYTLRSWPGFASPSCKLPAGWTPAVPPQKPFPAETARQYCSTLVDAARRLNCERDLMTTGEPAFVQAYLASERLARNLAPKPPELLSPRADEMGLAGSVLFEWKATSDRDGGAVRYLHCLWPTDEKLTFGNCRDVAGQSTVVSGLDAGRTYRWKVVVEDGQGASTVESETRRFVTK